jgi:antitoxin component YwqK of YwqJK toxin-antitoxin module
MKRIVKQRSVFKINVPPEGEFEDYLNGNRLDYGKTVFDENGNLIEEIKCDDGGHIIGVMKYTYNNKHQLIEEETMNELGEMEEKITYEPDDNGNILKQHIHYMDETCDTLTYEYENDKLVRKVLTTDEGEVESEEIFVYNGDQLISEKKTEEGETVLKNVFTYDDQGNVVSAEVENNDETYTLENEYDEKGHRIKTLKRDEEGKLLEKSLMKYDDAGNLIEIIEEDRFKKNTILIIYDENNNAIGQKEFNRHGLPNHEVERFYDGDGNVLQVRASIAGNDRQPAMKYILVYEYDFRE